MNRQSIQVHCPGMCNTGQLHSGTIVQVQRMQLKQPFLKKSTVIDARIPKEVQLVSANDDSPFHIQVARQCAEQKRCVT